MSIDLSYTKHKHVYDDNIVYYIVVPKFCANKEIFEYAVVVPGIYKIRLNTISYRYDKEGNFAAEYYLAKIEYRYKHKRYYYQGKLQEAIFYNVENNFVDLEFHRYNGIEHRTIPIKEYKFFTDYDKALKYFYENVDMSKIFSPCLPTDNMSVKKSIFQKIKGWFFK